jgi:hypothetical protein
MAEKKQIGKTLAGIGRIALNIVENIVINKIENEQLREGIRTLLQPVKGSLAVLSDNNPDDKAQIEEVWLEFMRSQELANYTEAQLNDLIEKIKIESIREGIKNLVFPTLRMFQALINTEPNNIKEIESIWLEFLRSESLRMFLLKEVDKLIHKVGHEKLRRALEILINPVVNTLSALVDVDLKNAQQLEELWLRFLKSQELSVFVLENIETLLSNIIKDEIIVSSILLFIKGALAELRI